MTQVQLNISDRCFREIASLVYDTTGIKLKEQKKTLVVSRLTRRLRTLGLSTFDDYVRFLNDRVKGDQEVNHLVNSITTNKTDFFREPHHFTFLKNALPDFVKAGDIKGRRKLRVWSSACSTGEEPYSIAMVLAEYFENIRGWNVKVLASDIDTNVLQQASEGLYKKQVVMDVPPIMRSKYFTAQLKDENEMYKVSDTLRRMIIFRKVNLIHDEFKFSEGVDFIFCRNVVIYFDDAGKAKLIGKFSRIMNSGSYIFVGHSESLLLAKKDFRFCKNTVYQKL